MASPTAWKKRSRVVSVGTRGKVTQCLISGEHRESERLQERRNKKYRGREGGGRRMKVTDVKKGCRCERNNRETQKWVTAQHKCLGLFN